MKKRILSILLSICMVFCFVPTGVFAEGEATKKVGTAQELVDAPADDTALRSVAVQNIGPNEAEVELDLYEKMSAQVSVIKLISDIELSGSLCVYYAVTIDLNGHVLKMGDIGDGSIIKVESTGDLTIIDSNPTAEHKFKVNGTDPWVLDEASGTESVRGGVIYGGKGLIMNKNGYGGGVYVDGGGTFTMTGGSIVGCKAEGYIAFGGGVFVAKGGTFEMTGGSITGCTAVAQGYGMAVGGGIRNDGDYNNSNVGRTTLSGTAEIRDCHAKGVTGANQLYGGGISDAGTLTISGDVKIIGCTAGGMGSDAMYVNANNDSSVTGGTFYGSIEDPGNRISGLTVTYCLNNDENYATQVVQSGDTTGIPDPVKDKHTFDGWYKDGTKRDAATPVTENLTLIGWLYKGVNTADEFTAALNDNSVDVIRLTDDITLPRQSWSMIIRDGRQLTLDLNGHVLDLGANTGINVGGGSVGIMTIMDSNPDAPHKFTPNADGLWVWDKGTGTGTETVLGGVITGSDSSSFSVISVGDSGSKVIMNGGNIVGHKTGGASGGAVHVTTGGQFTMNAGSIVGCTAKDGGAVAVGRGMFELTGGVIKSCKAVEDGGAVRVSVKDGTFTMTGGSIEGCTAANGGALCLYGTMNANGGTVSGTVVLDTKTNNNITHTGIIHGSGSNATQFNGDVTNYGEIGHGTFSGTVTLGNSTLSSKITGGTFNGPVTTDSGGEADISVGLFNGIVTINRGKITNGTFNKDVVVYNVQPSFSCTMLTGGTYNGLIINKSAYAAFAGAHNPLGIVETKPSSTYSNDQYRTVTFDLAGGNMDYPVRYFFEDGNISSEIKPAPRTGYTFGGWYKADGTAWNYASDQVTEDITLYAKWTPHTHTVTFDSTGGSEVTPKTMDVTYGEQLGDMPVPKREGYVFLGWYDTLAGGKCYGGSDGKSASSYDKDASITLYARWADAPSRDVRFNTCGGTMTDPLEVRHKTNTPIARPSDPTKPGYTFIGWYTDIACTQAWNFDDWVTEAMTLYAGWTVNRYTITFDTDGGSKIDPITQDYGTAITKPADPTRKGYTFAGWDKEIPTTMPAENITVKALWRINRYSITFDTDSGSKIDPITQDYGTTITKPADPTRKGYKFMGWDKEIPATMPAENVTVKAKWQDIEKPTGEISVGTNKWKTFLNNITFGLFFKNTQTVAVTAADNSGEAVKIEYLLSLKKLTVTELAGSAFTAYTSPFGINPDNEYIIYVKLTIRRAIPITSARTALCWTAQAP